MAACNTCGSMILFGGERHGNLRFCNAACLEKGAALTVAEQIAPETVLQAAREVHQNLCPVCGGSGPVDVHTGYKVWSLLLLTSWRNVPRISCRSCGLRHQFEGLFFSLFCGWWGFPWGIVMTPVQLGRNLKAMLRPPDPMHPSDELQTFMRIALAEGALDEEA
jgi:hypothetical protein